MIGRILEWCLFTFLCIQAEASLFTGEGWQSVIARVVLAAVVFAHLLETEELS